MTFSFKSLFFCFLFLNSASAQMVFYEDFERGPSTIFDCTNYYSISCPNANGFIVTTTLGAGVNCLNYNFPASVSTDISPTGSGYFLFHGTAREGSTLGEVWGTRIPVQVQANTNYIFSFYLANVFDISVAQIEPFINGISLGTQVSSVGLANWRRFSFCWNSGSANSADLSLRNNRDDAGGNDFIIDDVALERTSILTTSQNVTICAGQVFRVGNSTYTQTGNYRNVLRGFNGCDSVVLTNLTVSSLTPMTQNASICKGQSFNVGNKSYNLTGNFRDTLRSFSGCDSIIVTNLKVNDVPILSLPQGLKSKGCSSGDSLELNPRGDTVSKYVWQWQNSPCLSCRNPKVKPFLATTYYVKVTDKTTMCTISDSVKVATEIAYEEKIPNAFSPNGDNVNDIFNVVPDDCIKTVANLQIFNRWGNAIFEGKNLSPRNNEGWNGSFKGNPLGADVYVYIMEIQFIDGTTKKISGEVSLIH